MPNHSPYRSALQKWRAFAYQRTEVHRYAASSGRVNSGNTQLFSLLFLFFLSLFTQEVTEAALNGRLLLWKRKRRRTKLGLRLGMCFSLMRSSLYLNEYRKRSCTQHPDSYSSFILGTIPPGGCKISVHKIYFSAAFHSQAPPRDKPTVQNSANRLKTCSKQPKLCLFDSFSVQRHRLNTKKSFKHCINT